jgi:hypothetical protein
MTLLIASIGSLAFAGIAARFASRLSRRHAHPFAAK